MKIQIDQEGETLTHDFPNGTVVLGGDPSNEIYIEGLPPSLLVMQMMGAQLIVTAAEPVRIGGLRSPAFKPRLVFPEETIKLRRQLSIRSLENTARATSDVQPVPTSALALQLLGGRSIPIRHQPGVLCLTGHEMGRHYDLINGMTLGRGEGASVRLRDRSVSRRHASLHFTHHGCWVNNLGDTNGVFINDRKVRKAAYLEDGDVLRLGQSLLRIVLPRTETPEMPLFSNSWKWLTQLRLRA